MTSPVEIYVVGAGVVGLSTAVNLQTLPNCHVTIIADKFLKETVSDGAAGLFRSDYALSGTPISTVIRWLEDSWQRYMDIFLSDETNDAGITMLSGYHFKNEPFDSSKEKYYFCERVCNEKEMEVLGKGYKYGTFITTLLIDPRRYLAWLTHKFFKNGGRMQSTTLKDINELSGKGDIIVNCAGLNAKDITSDKSLYPIRGQILRVHAPHVNHFILTGSHYIIPCFDNVVLGGQRKVNDYNLKIDKDESKTLQKLCSEHFSSIKDAPVLWEWVGLRPYRSQIRLQIDKEISTSVTTILHNYGHGGQGITVSWGCAAEIKTLVEDVLQDKQKLNFKSKM